MTLTQNEEIRLVLLSQYYKELYQEVGIEAKIESLENVDGNKINANLIWLIDHHLLEGIVEYTGAGPIAFVSRISGLGMDVIEKMVRELTDKLDTRISNQIKVKESKEDRAIVFIDLCIKVTQLSNVITQFAHSMFGHS